MARIPQDHDVQHHMAELLARHLAAVNVLGRIDVLTAAKSKTGRTLPMATSSRLKMHFAEDAPAEQEPLKVGVGFGLPNEDAAEYIRNLTPVTKEVFDGLTTQYRKLAFTLAGTADVRLIAKVRDQLAEVVKFGGSSADLQTAVDEMTTDAGVEKINAVSLDNSFEIATHKAYSQGRYEQMTDPDTVAVLPYWSFMTVGDDRVRHAHADLDGFTARATDPIWEKIWPPCDWGCRCTVLSKFPEEVSPDADEPGYSRVGVLTLAQAAPASYNGLL